MSIAYLLVSHGSRDPRPQIEMQRLVRSVKMMVQSKFFNQCFKRKKGGMGVAAATISDICIGTATLELSSQSLEEQITLFASQASDRGCDHIKILPLFLLPGVHVMEDIPREVSQAQLLLGRRMKLELQPYLGATLDMKWLVARQMASTQVDKWILLAHGSRRPGALQSIEAIANHVGAVSAYWCMNPSWEEIVKKLADGGCKRIVILPYFLFPGGITDAIARSIEDVKLQFAGVNLHLAQPLAASADLPDLIGHMIADGTHWTREGKIFG
ncbi:Sirohydrochlorin cobaltochelatase [Richelia intracellularis]|nr:Sirohydrochlorin cobaltochelatase [Richelia intracellularis]